MVRRSQVSAHACPVHKLLEHQLEKLELDGPRPRGLDEFIAAVDAAYEQADRDRQMIERSLELASRALYERNEELKVDVERRKQLEIELAQAEKLRAVGQLAAGIAHELNTPIQYVGDNAAFLKQAFEALLGVFERALEAGWELPRSRKQMLFMYEQVPQAVEATLEGCQRVAEIVSALKLFAHPDRDGYASVDLNRALSSTVTVARNRLKHVAELTLELGELPEVECRAGEINQVFLNLIMNAADAIEDKHGPGRLGRLRIATYQRDDRAVIEIADDGAGIPREHRGRIFEPFFTTKEVGRGSGQGLAISRSIVVDKHGGALHFRTEEGEGTTFTVELPIKQPRVVTAPPPPDSDDPLVVTLNRLSRR